ncbi:MAG: DUF4180 domain-containing protein [Clostridiales bacterium]|nr:DUF4180 domain-containing protein [Clostridiales bacterium]
MNIRVIDTGSVKIAVIKSDTCIITDGQSALDLAAAIHYEHGARHIVIPKSAICADFFKLSTGVAGEVAQKFVNYGLHVAIVGDFSLYPSKPLQDYMYECNKGRHINFVTTDTEAIQKLKGAL